MTKDIMDVKEVAEYLNLSPTTIYRMLTGKEIPNVKVGGQYRFPKGVIDDWIAGKLEYPAASREPRAARKISKDKKQNLDQTKKTAGRVEDQIVGHLTEHKAKGDYIERENAKRLMLDKLHAVDWAHLAIRAEQAGVLDEALAVQDELIKEASQ